MMTTMMTTMVPVDMGNTCFRLGNPPGTHDWQAQTAGPAAVTRQAG